MTWDEIYDAAIDCGCGDAPLKVKDTARWEVRCLVLEKEGYDLDEVMCPEDDIEDYCNTHDIVFYKNGYIKSYS